MRQYFLTIPKDYEEAAKLDGAGYFKTYWRVMLPLAAPALAAVAILTFQGIWNELLLAANVLQDPDPQVHDADRAGELPLPVPDALAAADGRRATLAILPVAAHVRLLPALLRRGRCSRRGQGMTPVPRALLRVRRCGGDFYEQSWRLVLLNALCSVCVLVVLVLALCVPPALSCSSSRSGRCSRRSCTAR